MKILNTKLKKKQKYNNILMLDKYYNQVNQKLNKINADLQKSKGVVRLLEIIEDL